MFDQITSVILGNNEIRIFKSNRSKLTVAVTNCRGPIIRANFNFVTEASDDSGIPHMLEHCIFYGCQLHNGKGILDIASNLNYVVDTNASTTQDSTSYYFDCANFTGFINAFKLFFEHLLSPLLEINNYKTEVHSIGGEGLDIGVLYSEISGVERNFRRIVNNRTRKMLYGDSSVYSYNTGGLLNEIRIGCHVEKIIDFHNRYYHLDNLVRFID
uniref:Peptidase M16 N-terminal domain-containing protein n=1 Tax=Meloidogyne incognita TaxID=6306 RepID=A0A914MZT6_MELIC